MGIVLSIIGGAVVLTLIGFGLNVLVQKLSKNEVNKTEENKQ